MGATVVLLARERRPSWMRVVLSTFGPVAAVTLLSQFPHHVGVATAALAYVLAVATAAAIGGFRAGFAASLISFVGLHYFFTPPRDVLFRLPGTQDVTALLVFLIVSILVGAMLSSAQSQRLRAEQREAMTQILHQVATQLLAGERIERVLQRFADSVARLLGLAACEVATVYTADRIVAGDVDALDGREITFSMIVRGRSVGRLRARPAGRSELREDEREALASFADQLALALDTVELSAQVREAQLEAEANKARAALFSSVTHDIRTPLASILASATTLRAHDRMGTDDRAELVGAICEETRRLDRLVGNLMDLSRVRAGALTPQRVPVPVDELVSGVLARMERELSAHEIVVRIASGLPDVPMDLIQLDQVLTNLLENASKFAPAGSPITISAVRDDGRLRLAVIDEGPGIPPGDRERVFDPFVRGRVTDGAGAGLGLAICRAIVGSHGGSIRIDDRHGPGTSVIVELPLEVQ